ncbi:type II toxin-antitoxin system PemK/MazF family toxin [uncultured Cellulomonas sp.]|uniref:type II toxin-antitoxin system PemK/MazF family toxin n=1 Tax=uncultured Cellulomonas sp. TaxID=189682 RepID=UPI0028EB61B7|nr:type II toxin-antitoxin system PemK/MazF family toxin [uncultured Cellulomonas sp.]
MRRGDIYLADLGQPVGHEQGGTRPVLVLSAQPWLDSNPPVVTVVPITRTPWVSPTRIEIEPGGSGLKATSYARCEDAAAISPQRLTSRFGSADPLVILRVEQALRRLLAL